MMKKDEKRKQEDLIKAFKEKYSKDEIPPRLRIGISVPREKDDIINLMKMEGLSEEFFLLLLNLFLISVGSPIVLKRIEPMDTTVGKKRIVIEKDGVLHCWKVAKEYDDGRIKIFFKFCNHKGIYHVYEENAQLKNDPLLKIDEFRKSMMIEIAKDFQVDFNVPSNILNIKAQKWATLRELSDEKQIIMVQKLFQFLKDVADAENLSGMNGIHTTQQLDKVSKAGTPSKK